MADFVAVLRKTLDGLGEATPEMRARVYDKARSTVAAKLAAISPPPPEALADRQRQALEDAIKTVESEYTPAKPAFEDPLEELESVFAALKEGKPIAPAKPPAPPVAAKPAAAPIAPPKPAVQTVQPTPVKPVPAAAPVQQKPAPTQTPSAPKAAPVAPKPMPKQEPDFGFDAPERETVTSDDRYDYEAEEPMRRRRGFAGPIAAVVALVVIASGGYGIWLNKEEFSQMVGLDLSKIGLGSSTQTAEGTTTPPPTADANNADPSTPHPANSQQASGDTQKFTQRLNEDGTEVDAGPAGGNQTFGEGTSVAALTPVAADQAPPVTANPATPPAPTESSSAAAPEATPPMQPGATPDTANAPVDGTNVPPPATTPPAAPQQTASAPQATPAVAVGQRAIFYEERTNSAAGSAEPGSIVWTEVQESPGGDQPPEPAIRAEATIPGKDIQLRMTIRRNADKTLPASHIVEMIFLTPENFEGGGIDNVLRIAFKSSEQDAGSPLAGIPAKIADGFFLVALNDTQNEIQSNLGLLQRQSWIDIPIIYKNGRRALFTMEKGVPGTKVFDDAIKAWQPKTAG